jgi:hypothetical protein
MKLLTKIIFIGLIAFSFLGCTKVEGLGGKAMITGKLSGQFYSDDQLTLFNGTGVLADEDVYIVYGTGDTYFDDDIKSSYDGSFQFKYLRPGKYTVFVYENCFPCSSLQEVVLSEIEITAKDQVVDLGTITLKKKI